MIYETTTNETWWPSRYGPDDQAGALNEITPATILRAAALVQTARVYDLAHVLDVNAPAFEGRTFHQYLTTSAHQLNRRAPNAGPVLVVVVTPMTTCRGNRQKG